MLYDSETTTKIVLRCYEYLQIRMRIPPRPINMNTNQHQTWVKRFIEAMPPSAGVDFIWDFLLFQFYTYSYQTHKIEPNPSWFLGKEAWRRYYEYEDGNFYFSRKWGSEHKYTCPVKSQNYTPISKDALEAERLRMSRISGPNYCVAKYGEGAYDEDSEMCVKCPHEKTCYTLFRNDGALYRKLEELPDNVCHVKLSTLNPCKYEGEDEKD